jgi:hypothetical protein
MPHNFVLLPDMSKWQSAALVVVGLGRTIETAFLTPQFSRFTSKMGSDAEGRLWISTSPLVESDQNSSFCSRHGCRRSWLRRFWTLCLLLGLSDHTSSGFRPVAAPRRIQAPFSNTALSLGSRQKFSGSAQRRRNDNTTRKRSAGAPPSQDRFTAGTIATKEQALQQAQQGGYKSWLASNKAGVVQTDERQKSLNKGTATLLGGILSLGIVLILASGYSTVGGDPTTAATSFTTSVGPWDGSTAADLERLRDKIIEASFPMTASDALSVVFGEGFAGVIGGFVSAVLTSIVASVLRSMSNKASAFRNEQATDTSPLADSTAIVGSRSTTRSRIGGEVVASGDYFLTRAAALPLLEATGLSSSLAMVASVLVASVPYEIVKYSQRQREIMIEEKVMMQELLDEQQSIERRPWINLSSAFSFRPSQGVDLTSLKPIMQGNDLNLDLVEVFADITKWLGYAALVENYGGALAWSGLIGAFPYSENFLFGAIANLSSQVYSDLLYARFGFGGEDKQRAVLSRTAEEWLSLYVSSTVTGATLFGVYEAAQIPAKVLTSALFSGGVEGCYGSSDYNLCVESFLFNGLSPPGPSLEAQLRAIVTTLASLSNRLGLDVPFAI